MLIIDYLRLLIADDVPCVRFFVSFFGKVLSQLAPVVEVWPVLRPLALVAADSIPDYGAGQQVVFLGKWIDR